jgi:hypothetical protein
MVDLGQKGYAMHTFFILRSFKKNEIKKGTQFASLFIFMNKIILLQQIFLQLLSN